MARIAKVGITLTGAQQQAVLHAYGPLLVFAGPGSGKTTLLTLRALCLTQVSEVPAEQIALVTFTKKSARELRRRLVNLDSTLADCYVGTFHSLFLRWLMEFSATSPRILSAAKSSALQWDAWRQAKGRSQEARREDAQHRYQDAKAIAGHWDYDDILSHFHRLVSQDENAREQISKRTPFWMVDEFQDTNRIQWESINLLCNQRRDLAAVGDDDQAIYGFRGATPHVMLAFKEVYAEAQEVYLSHNFRSTDPIIHAATRLIRHNSQRRDKDVQTVRGDGAAVRVLSFADEYQEAQTIATWIEDRRKRSQGTFNGAVLARTNSQLYAVMDALARHQIRFATHRDTRPFWQDGQAQQVLAVASLCSELDHACKPLDWERAITFLGGSPSLLEVHRYLRCKSARERLESLVGDPHFGPFATRTLALLLQLQQASPGCAITLIQEQHARRAHDRNWLPDDHPQAIMAALANSTKGHDTLSGWLTYVRGLETARIQNTLPADLSLLTLHGAKGLEFDDVMIVGLHADACPHPQSLSKSTYSDTDEALAEERRLLYVGMTRARTRLDLTYPRTSHGRMRVMSPFLTELSQAESTLAKMTRSPATSQFVPMIGAICEHAQWGRATVASADVLRPGLTKVCIACFGQQPRYVYWEQAVRSGVIRLIEDALRCEK